MIQMIYQKANGEIIERIRSTYSPYRIGDRTSMGWRVLSIKYFYKGKYYDRVDFDKLVDRDWNKHKKINLIKKKISSLYHNLSYFFILLILMKTYGSLNIV